MVYIWLILLSKCIPFGVITESLSTFYPEALKIIYLDIFLRCSQVHVYQHIFCPPLGILIYLADTYQLPDGAVRQPQQDHRIIASAQPWFLSQIFSRELKLFQNFVIYSFSILFNYIKGVFFNSLIQSIHIILTLRETKPNHEHVIRFGFSMYNVSTLTALSESQWMSNCRVKVAGGRVDASPTILCVRLITHCCVRYLQLRTFICIMEVEAYPGGSRSNNYVRSQSYICRRGTHQTALRLKRNPDSPQHNTDPWKEIGEHLCSVV